VESTDQPLVKLAIAPNEVIALMWRELLTTEGIPVLVRVAGPGMAYFSPALCEHGLYVREADVRRARRLLNAFTAVPDEVIAHAGDGPAGGLA
jgi:hypothetical protein